MRERGRGRGIKEGGRGGREWTDIVVLIIEISKFFRLVLITIILNYPNHNPTLTYITISYPHLNPTLTTIHPNHPYSIVLCILGDQVWYDYRGIHRKAHLDRIPCALHGKENQPRYRGRAEPV